MFGHGKAIGEDVVIPRRAHGARETDAVHLDWCRAKGKDVFPAVERVAVAVEENGDPVLSDALRNAGCRLFADIGEMLESRPRPALERIVVVAPETVGEHLQAGAIDLFPELERQ